jgi:hypothetical protein
MPTFGVVVFSLPGMKHLAACLRSVEWADELLLLRAGGERAEFDAGEFSKLRVRAVGSAAEAEKYAAEMKTDWVLRLWADERLEAGLADELRALSRAESREFPAPRRIPVRSYILRRWAEGSVSDPGPALRLGRNAKEIPSGWWKKAPAASKTTRGWIGDYGCAKLSDAVERVQSLSDFWVEGLGSTIPEPGAAKAVLCSLRVFVKLLFLNRFLGRGLAGVTLSALASYAVLLSGAKLWEARHATSK